MTIFFYLAVLLSQSKKKAIFAVGLMILAFFFHKSAIVLAPMLLMRDKAIKHSQYPIYFGGAILISFVLIILSDSLGGFVSSMMNDQFEGYSAYMEGEGAYISLSFFNILNMSIIYFLLGTNIYALTKKLNRFEYIAIKLSCVFYMIQVVPSIGVSARFMYYMLFPFMIGCATVVRTLKPSFRTAYIFCIIIISFLSIRALMQSPFFISTYAIYNSILF